jgi:sulfide:quinone oxidoreductase
MGAAYEFLFNLEKWLREEGIRDKVEITWITPKTSSGTLASKASPVAKRCWNRFARFSTSSTSPKLGVTNVEPHTMTLSNRQAT